MNSRIAPLEPAQAQPHARELLAAVQAKLGMTPNMMKTMANSPAVLEGYLSLNAALGKGSLSPATREQLALAVGQANTCEYCVAAHTLLGKFAGLKPDQMIEARKSHAQDAKAQAALTLAGEIVEQRGDVTDSQLAAARQAQLSDSDLAEVVAHVALNILTNYFNKVAKTEVDFPAVPLKL